MGLFQTFDDQGVLQLDCDLFSHFLRFKGIGTTIARKFGNTEASDVEIVIGPQYQLPLVGIQCPYFVGFLAMNPDGAGNRLWQAVSDAPVGTPFTYWVFDTSAVIPPNSGLFELYAEDGRVTFSDAAKPMLGLDLLTIGSTTSRLLPWTMTTTGSTGTYPGRSICWVQGGYGGFRNIGRLQAYSGPRPVEPSGGTETYTWRYVNMGKVFGGRAWGDTATAGPISFDDVQALIGNGTQSWAEARYAELNKWEVPLVGFAVDVTNT